MEAVSKGAADQRHDTHQEQQNRGHKRHKGDLVGLDQSQESLGLEFWDHHTGGAGPVIAKS